MEYFDICDDHGVPTGEIVSRERAHAEGIMHRTAHVWLVRCREGRFQVLLQRRSRRKDSFPGCLDTSSAGHIPAGCEPAESAVRELKEELGLEASPEELEYAGQFQVAYDLEFHGKPFRDREIVWIYLLHRDVDAEKLQLQEEELEGAGWYDFIETCRKCMPPRDPDYCVPLGGLRIVARALGVPFGEGSE